MKLLRVSAPLMLMMMLVACGETDETSASAQAVPEVSQTPALTAIESGAVRTPDIPPPSAHIALNPGRYVSDEIVLEVSALRFDLAEPEGRREISGRFEIINGVLLLNPVDFKGWEPPERISCRLSREGPRLVFSEPDEGSCDFLAERRFQRDTAGAFTRQ